MEGSNSSRRLSIDEQHMAANLPAEQAKDEEIVARSGDPGMLDSSQASDPWSTGEIEHLERKWLQKELSDRAARDTGSFHSSSVRMASLERMGSVTSARFSHARSSRSSADQQIFEIGQTSGNAASSTSQMGSLENEPERVSPDPAIAHSPLSDSPLFPKSAALREPFEGLPPQSSRRLSIDEQHMAANLLAEQAKDEEIVARSGDPGMLDFYQASDPWSSGEIEHLERKWLQKELRDRAARDTGSFHSSCVRMASLERMGSVTSARFSHARSSRSSRRSSADQQIFEIGQTSGNAASSTSQMGSLENEPERVSPDPPFAHSPLSDSPLFPKSALREPFEGLAPQLSAAHRRPRDRPTKEDRCHHSLEYIGTLAHLACFGIIGVLIRYGLEVLFADVLSITREGTIIYRDLPANVVGSFFMGWVGIVLKKDILFFSEPLAIGLSTGLMGSITTYAAWNQKMVVLLTTGNIVAALSGLILGMAIAQLSLLAGIDSAKGLKWAIGKLQQHRVQNEVTENELKGICRLSPDNNRRRMVSFMVFAFTTACLWGAALALLIKGGSPQNVRILWLACIVAPPGVWSRWHLARFNGKGLGGRLKWLPVGTLLANLLAATLEAVLTFLQLVVTDDGAPLLIGGLQLGFLGCLSTVSTFVAEVYTMHVGPMKPKAYAYTFTTLMLGLALGIMLYSCPAWTKGYAKW